MRSWLVSVLISVFVAAAAAAAPITYSDGTFADSDWTLSTLIDTTGGASVSGVQIATGGNPGSYRFVTHILSLGTIFIAHTRGAFVYDPAVSGALASIDYGFDLINVNGLPSEAVAYSILLEQNGTYYGPTLDLIFGASGWRHFGLTGLASSQFAKIAGSGPSTPDFSAGAGAITLGFVSANTNSGGAPNYRLESGIDNWAVSLTPVPEPAVAAMLALGALLRRRRR